MNETTSQTDTSSDTSTEPSTISRRTLLGSSTLAAVAASLIPQKAHASNFGIGSSFNPQTSVSPNTGHPIFGDNRGKRRLGSYRLRIKSARAHFSDSLVNQRTNGDEGIYSGDYRASFTKALPHDTLGEVDSYAYQSLLTALASGEHNDFENVPLGGVRKLANPQAAYKFEMVGTDSHSTFMRPAPSFSGAETAVEMVELYWKALCRDIPFAEYDTNPMIAAAATELNQYSAALMGSGNSENIFPYVVNPETVFRGETPGDLDGPHISQFLLKDVPYGNTSIEQRYVAPAAGIDYMTDYTSWLNVQNGAAATPLVPGPARYISDARALGEFVHKDFSFQSYLSAALIMLGIPGSLDIGNLYRTSATQGAFVSLGGPDVLDLVTKAGNLSLTGAWYQKWLVHRRLRPETYAGRLHNQLIGEKIYGLPSEVSNSEALDRVYTNNGTYLLPMAFPEGSPTHPSYPAGHATIAGACATVLKAFFDEDALMPDPVMTDSAGSSLLPYYGTLTLGGEINKLANNIALGRDWAGVHYRSDGVDGLLVGEQQALGLLRDYSLTYRETFDGFTLTKFDGTQVRITAGTMITI